MCKLWWLVLAVQLVVAVAAAGAGAEPEEPVGLTRVLVHLPCWRTWMFPTLL